MSRFFHPRSRLLAGAVSLTVLLGVSLVVTTSVLSQSGGLIPPDQILLRRGTDPPSPPDGPALFLGNCATCHDNHNPGDDDPSDNARTILRGRWLPARDRSGPSAPSWRSRPGRPAGRDAPARGSSSLAAAARGGR